jgi:ribonucleoside-diphosphate reductase alpha chain
MTSQREPLPSRRACETITFNFRGLSYDLSVGRFEDGRLAEVFIACSKSTSPSAADARDACVLISVACQFGASPEALRRAITRVEEPMLGEMKEVPAGIGGAILDIIAADLGGFGPEKSA